MLKPFALFIAVLAVTLPRRFEQNYAVFPAGRPTEPVLLDGLYSSPEPFANAIRQSTKQSENASAMIGG